MTKLFKQLPLINLVVLLTVLFFVIYQNHWLWILILLFFLNRLRQYSPKTIVQILLVVLVFAGFFAVQKMNNNKYAKELSVDDRQFDVQMDTISVNGNQLSFVAQSNHQSFQCFYRLNDVSEQKLWQEVARPLRIVVYGTAQKAAALRNLNGFDYQSYLKSRGINQTINISQIKAISVRERLSFFSWLSFLRRKAIVHIDKSFKAPLSSYMQGLLLGFTPKSFNESLNLYSTLGIIHLFAISGMQVTFFINKLHYFLLRCGVLKEHLPVFDLVFSIFYAAITGLQVSIIRALLANLFQYFKIKSSDNFALTLLIVLIFMPKNLLSQSAQLSFILAFLLLELKPLMLQAKRLRDQLRGGMLVALGILPILLFYFHEWQPLSIVLTVIFACLFDYFLLPTLLILFFLSIFGLAIDVNFLFLGLENIVYWVAKLSFKPLIIGKPTAFLLLVAVLAVFTLLDSLYLKRSIKLPLVILLGCLAITKYNPFGIIAIVDVGQGDSIVIQTPFNRKTVVIDVGGKLEFLQEKWQQGSFSTNAEKTLIPFLKSRGIDTIDLLVASHADADHIGDIASVANKIKIKEILLTRGSLNDSNFVSELKTIQPPPKFKIASVGQRITLGGKSSLQVLYPKESTNGKNQDSIVLFGNLWGVCWLFTGDLEAEGERSLLKSYNLSSVDMLKIGHHGSQTSSTPEFISSLQPKFALISCGENNRFKHPHPKTLQTLKANHVTIKRTDKDGMIYAPLKPFTTIKGLKTIK
ncbi:MAG: DNA internalization-related competence protein ComEC/Rec2 [Streptococcaceae bacterium]|nr:DNA internalization-related competence protein ComEC/Rec2 [Streptococcaceae bacterium]